MNLRAIIIILFIGLAVLTTAAQTKQIEAIKKTNADTDKKISDAEKAYAKAQSSDDAPDTDIYLNQLVFNKGKTNFPDSGLY